MTPVAPPLGTTMLALPSGWAGLTIVLLAVALWGLKRLPMLKGSWVHSTWWTWVSSALSGAIPVVIGVVEQQGLNPNAITAALLGFVMTFVAQDNPGATPAMRAAMQAKPTAPPPLPPPDPDATSKGPRVASLLLPFMAFGALSLGALDLSGCPGCDEVKRDTVGIAQQCLVPAIEDLVLKYIPQVAVDLIGENYGQLLGDLEGELKTQGIADGGEVIACAVSVISANKPPAARLAAMDPASPTVKMYQHAAQYLASHPVK